MPARNVLNTAELDRFVDDLARLSDRPALQRWVRGPVRRWILKEHRDCHAVEIDPATGAPAMFDQDDCDFVELPEACQPLPDWLATALARRDEVVVLGLDPGLQDRVVAVLAFLEDETRFARRGALDRLGFAAAERLAEAARTGRAALPDGDATVFRFEDGTRVVQLASAAALRTEGDRMRHCAGSYVEHVRRGRCRIFSLRGAGRRPAATIEIDREGNVVQVRGFANQPVAAHDRARLLVFLEARGYRDEAPLRHLPALADRMVRTGCDIEAAILSPFGRAFLRRRAWMVGDWAADAEARDLTEGLAESAWELSPRARRAIFDALVPRPPVARLQADGGFWVYDSYLPVCRVALPLVVINLALGGLFDGLGLDEETAALRAAAEGALVALAFSPPDRLYDLGAVDASLGPVDLYFGTGLGSPADLLRLGGIDLSGPRARRHDMIRHRLNRERRRPRHRRLPPSEGHVVVKEFLRRDGEHFVV